MKNSTSFLGDIVHENGSFREIYGLCDQAPALEIGDYITLIDVTTKIL